MGHDRSIEGELVDAEESNPQVSLTIPPPVLSDAPVSLEVSTAKDAASEEEEKGASESSRAPDAWGDGEETFFSSPPPPPEWLLEHHDGGDPNVEFPPELLARRARYRRWVTWGVAGLFMFSAANGVHLALTDRGAVATALGERMGPASGTAEFRPAAGGAERPSADPATGPEPQPPPETVLQEMRVGADDEQEAPAGHKIAPNGPPQGIPKGAPSPARSTVQSRADSAASPGLNAKSAPTAQAPTNAKAEVKRLMGKGHMREAATLARTAVASDPTDAEGYLLLGAALQESGSWKESSAVFSRCAKEATHGPKQECRAFAH